MVQWINIFQNNSFVNPTQLPCYAKKLEPCNKVLWLAAREMLLHLEIFKTIYWTIHWKFSGIQKSTMSLQWYKYILVSFSCNLYPNNGFQRCTNCGHHCFRVDPYYLVLHIILNDIFNCVVDVFTVWQNVTRISTLVQIFWRIILLKYNP